MLFNLSQCMDNKGALVCFTIRITEPLHMTVQHNAASLSSSKLLEAQVSVQVFTIVSLTAYINQINRYEITFLLKSRTNPLSTLYLLKDKVIMKVSKLFVFKHQFPHYARMKSALLECTPGIHLSAD